MFKPLVVGIFVKENPKEQIKMDFKDFFFIGVIVGTFIYCTMPLKHLEYLYVGNLDNERVKYTEEDASFSINRTLSVQRTNGTELVYHSAHLRKFTLDSLDIIEKTKTNTYGQLDLGRETFKQAEDKFKDYLKRIEVTKQKRVLDSL